MVKGVYTVKRLLHCFFILILLLALVPKTASAGEDLDENLISDSDDHALFAEDEEPYPVVTKEQAIEILRKALREHVKTVRFTVTEYIGNFWTSEEIFNHPGYALLDEACKDIPAFFYGSSGALFYVLDVYGTDPAEDGRYEYRFSYPFSKKKTAAFEKKLRKTLKSLKLNGLSKKKKALKIYGWITRNVKYKRNRTGYGPEHTAYNALMKKKAVCDGISDLYFRMLKDSGVDARVILGRLNGRSHAWVLVKIGKKWYNADPTADLGRIKNTFRCFLKTNKAFRGYKREAMYKTKSFVSSHPMGKKNLKY